MKLLRKLRIEPEEGFELPPQDQEELQSIAGGSEGYAHMTAFAAAHLPEEFVNQYDRIMSSGSYPEMQEVIQALHGWYINNGGPQVGWHRPTATYSRRVF